MLSLILKLYFTWVEKWNPSEMMLPRPCALSKGTVKLSFPQSWAGHDAQLCARTHCGTAGSWHHCGGEALPPLQAAVPRKQVKWQTSYSDLIIKLEVTCNFQVFAWFFTCCVKVIFTIVFRNPWKFISPSLSRKENEESEGQEITSLGMSRGEQSVPL